MPLSDLNRGPLIVGSFEDVFEPDGVSERLERTPLLPPAREDRRLLLPPVDRAGAVTGRVGDTDGDVDDCVPASGSPSANILSGSLSLLSLLPASVAPLSSLTDSLQRYGWSIA